MRLVKHLAGTAHLFAVLPLSLSPSLSVSPSLAGYINFICALLLSLLFIYLFIRSPAQLFKGNKMGPMGRALFMAKRFEANFVLPTRTASRPLSRRGVSRRTARCAW